MAPGLLLLIQANSLCVPVTISVSLTFLSFPYGTLVMMPGLPGWFSTLSPPWHSCLDHIFTVCGTVYTICRLWEWGHAHDWGTSSIQHCQLVSTVIIHHAMFPEACSHTPWLLHRYSPLGLTNKWLQEFLRWNGGLWTLVSPSSSFLGIAGQLLDL